MSESSSELPGDQGLYALLPAVYRVRDSEQGLAPAGPAVRRRGGAAHPGGGRRGALRRLVRGDLRRVGGALHRRPARRARAPGGRRRALQPAQPGGQHPGLPAREGHGSGPGAAGKGRHRLAGQGGGAVRAPGHHTARQPPPPLRAGHRQPAQRGRPGAAQGPLRQRPPRRGRAPRGQPPGAAQHPPRGHLPVALAELRRDPQQRPPRSWRRPRPGRALHLPSPWSGSPPVQPLPHRDGDLLPGRREQRPRAPAPAPGGRGPGGPAPGRGGRPRRRVLLRHRPRPGGLRPARAGWPDARRPAGRAAGVRPQRRPGRRDRERLAPPAAGQGLPARAGRAPPHHAPPSTRSRGAWPSPPASRRCGWR